MVTEPVFASSLDLLTRFEGLPGKREPVRLSELDCKAGLLQAIALFKKDLAKLQPALYMVYT